MFKTTKRRISEDHTVCNAMTTPNSTCSMFFI